MAPEEGTGTKDYKEKEILQLHYHPSITAHIKVKL